MGLGGVAIVILPSIMCLKLTFSDGLGGGEIVVYDFTSRTNISIAPDGDAFHRVDGTPTHPNPFVDDYLSTVFCHNNAALRQSKHIAEWMGENVDFTPPSVVKKDIRPFHSTPH